MKKCKYLNCQVLPLHPFNRYTEKKETRKQLNKPNKCRYWSNETCLCLDSGGTRSWENIRRGGRWERTTLQTCEAFQVVAADPALAWHEDQVHSLLFDSLASSSSWSWTRNLWGNLSLQRLSFRKCHLREYDGKWNQKARQESEGEGTYRPQLRIYLN